MYLDQFGLNVNPFGLSHKLDFLFKSGAFQETALEIFGPLLSAMTEEN